MRILVLVLAILLICLQGSVIAQKDVSPHAMIIAGEAGGEGYKGMYAVACVIQNRGGSTKGFYGLTNKVALRNYYANKKVIDSLVLRMGKLKDSTKGATHFENVEAFGYPKWAKNMIKTCKIGHHTFFKRR